MALYVATCPKFLSLLGSFYETMPEPLPLTAQLIGPTEMPEPYRRLLVHTNDMTPTLQQYHREELELRVLQRRSVDKFFFRHIVLEGKTSGRAHEYGAIRITLPALTEPARRQVLECHVPLGGILNALGITHRSCPGGFFRVRPNQLMNEVLEIDNPQWLFGRCNCLTNAAGHAIAEVIEILPTVSRSKKDL